MKSLQLDHDSATINSFAPRNLRPCRRASYLLRCACARAVSVNPITGSNGAGLLLDTGCLPSAPLSGGPWQIFGIVNGKLAPIGKPLYAEGEMGDFVPGKVNHRGNFTQILPDELRIRLFTDYFFKSSAR